MKLSLLQSRAEAGLPTPACVAGELGGTCAAADRGGFFPRNAPPISAVIASAPAKTATITTGQASRLSSVLDAVVHADVVGPAAGRQRLLAFPRVLPDQEQRPPLDLVEHPPEVLP